MSTDVESVLNLSVIYENDEEILDDGRVYHFYKYGESIEDTAMKVECQLAEYQNILDCLCQHSAEHRSMRKRLSKITKRTIAEQSRNKCHVCNVPINPDNSFDYVTCDSCKQSPICRNLHCAIWSDKSKMWNCKLCRSYLHGSSSACDWLITQINERLLQGKNIDDHSKKIVWSNNDDSAPLIPLEQREKVREFVEELVSTLVGGSIDNAPVGQLFENKECLPTGENETASIDESHTNLKHLVERIIDEVFKIPELFDLSGVPKEPQRINLPHFDPKKYEELLATAVLNELVESYSYERRFENSSGIHSGSDIDGNVQSILQKAQLEDLSTSSSNEPRSDNSNSFSLNDQPMSLTATDFIGNLSRENSVDSPINSHHSVDSDEEAYLSDYIQKHKVPLPRIEAHELVETISPKETTPDSDVYTARIVQIRDDPGNTSDDSTKLKLLIADRLSDNSSSLSLQSDSLLSDDSETRVYDLRKNETAYLRSDIIRTSRIPIGATATPPSTPIDGESLHKNLDQFFAIKQLNELKKSEEEQESTSQQKSPTFHSVRGVSKPLSPETLKFFTPKPKPVFTSKLKMEETAPIKPLILEREDNVIPQNGTIEKGVIEEDVISTLPTVKALAKNFVEPSGESTKQPIQRPKTFVWQVSNEIVTNTNGHTKEPLSDFYHPNYESSYDPVAPGHSITARSLSTKFREELRHSISDDASNGSDNIEIVERDHSPDRPSSPVLLKGIFKEKMSFFQNLENK